MGRIGRYIQKTSASVKETILRFALVPLFLCCLTVLIALQIEETFGDNSQTVTRVIFAAIFGAFLGTAFEFITERFERLIRIRWLIQAFAALFAILYYFVYTTPDKTDVYTGTACYIFRDRPAARQAG